MEEKVCNINGTNIFYKIRGSGPALLLIHGFGETGDIWNEIIKHLPGDFTIIIPDLPGSGRSQLIKANPVTIDDYAKVLHTLIEKELGSDFNDSIKDPITIIGHSMGGYIALSYLNQYPHEVRKLGLFHSSAYADTEEKISTRKKAIDFIKRIGAPEFLKTTIPDLFSKKTQADNYNMISNLVQKGNNFSNETLIQYYEAMINRQDSIELIKKAAIPFMFIIGEEDKAVPLNQSLMQCHLPFISYVEILKDVAHMGMLEEPVQTGKAILNFMHL